MTKYFVPSYIWCLWYSRWNYKEGFTSGLEACQSWREVRVKIKKRGGPNINGNFFSLKRLYFACSIAWTSWNFTSSRLWNKDEGLQMYAYLSRLSQSGIYKRIRLIREPIPGLLTTQQIVAKIFIEVWVTNGQMIEDVANRHMNEMVSREPCPSTLQIKTRMKSGWNASFLSLVRWPPSWGSLQAHLEPMV